MKKLAMVLLAATIAVLSVQLLPGADAGDGYFVVDGLSYYIEGENVALYYVDVASIPSSDVVIPESVSDGLMTYQVTGISEQVFVEEGVTSVSIPWSVYEIGLGTFDSNTIREIKVDPENYWFCSEDGVLYDRDMTVILRYPVAKTDDVYVAPYTVANIYDEAFAFNEHLKEVILPDTVMTIGVSAFNSCYSLEKINFNGETNCLPEAMVVLDTQAFAHCRSLKNLVMNDNLRVVNSYAFDGSGLEYVYISYKVSAIAEGAFSMCPLKTIESDNFTYMVKDNILLERRNNTVTLFTYPAGSEAEYYKIPDGISYIAPYAFSGCLHLKTVETNSNLISIPPMSFTDCKSLERVILSDEVMIIEGLAFLDCENLKHVEFGGHVSVLEVFSFSNTGIEDLVLPESVTSVKSCAFMDCKNLRTVEVPDTDVVLEQYFLYGCFSLESVTINGPDVVLEDYVFGVGLEESPVTFKLTVDKDLRLPEVLGNEYTEIEVEIIGERPYPYENFIGVAACLIVLGLIIYAVRDV
jgi:hypothetical protein